MDTKTPSPSDAEIAALYLQETGFDINDSPAALLDFARAVLARWGQPMAVAGREPVAHKQGCPALGGYGNGVEPCCCGAAPPPQAVLEPLTPEQIKDEASHHGFIGSTDRLVEFVRGIEAAHGITKGGQHGAE